MLSGLSHIISWGATWDYKLQGLLENKLAGTLHRLYRAGRQAKVRIPESQVAPAWMCGTQRVSSSTQ